jgi:PhnB protein
MDAIVPYLNFDGNAAEALEFYAKALNGKVIFQQKFGDSPMNAPESHKDKLMHASFEAGDLKLMASDCPPGFQLKQGNNMSLSMNFADVATIEKVFNEMSQGATVTMPLQDTFWNAKFGMLTDKFGINWMFNHDLQKKDK